MNDKYREEQMPIKNRATNLCQITSEAKDGHQGEIALPQGSAQHPKPCGLGFVKAELSMPCQETNGKRKLEAASYIAICKALTLMCLWLKDHISYLLRVCHIIDWFMDLSALS
jgi:hypothetical protein